MLCRSQLRSNNFVSIHQLDRDKLEDRVRCDLMRISVLSPFIELSMILRIYYTTSHREVACREGKICPLRSAAPNENILPCSTCLCRQLYLSSKIRYFRLCKYFRLKYVVIGDFEPTFCFYKNTW